MEKVRQYLSGDTGRLAATYLAIIMALTIVFSTIIYGISTAQLNRPLPMHRDDGFGFSQFDDSMRDNVQHLFEQRADQARDELLLSLVFLNIAVLIGGAMLSYYLARRTLEPIEQVMEAQNRFVSDASHELRTPLTALQVTNEVALRKKKLTLEQARELIGYNLAETIKLKSLSDALLGLARHEHADTTVSEFDIKDVVGNAVSSVAPQADLRAITIDADVAATTVSANAPAVEQILRVLLDNAVKYSPDGTTVRVTGDIVPSSASINVTDQGPGIAPEHRSKIFDRFYRVDESRSSANVEGNGLGLAIAKTIANRHGYKLLLRSTKKGSTFTLMIPRK